MSRKTKITRKMRGKLISKREAAERLGVTARSIERMLLNRELSYTKPVHRILIPESEINELIQKGWKEIKASEKKGTSDGGAVAG